MSDTLVSKTHLTYPEVLDSVDLKDPFNAHLAYEKNADNSPMINGLHQSLIKFCIWFNVLLLALYYYKNPLTAFKTLKRLQKQRSDFRGKYPVIKYAKANGKYYYTFNAPGWPSLSFNKYILNNVKKNDSSKDDSTLDAIILASQKNAVTNVNTALNGIS